MHPVLVTVRNLVCLGVLWKLLLVAASTAPPGSAGAIMVQVLLFLVAAGTLAVLVSASLALLSRFTRWMSGLEEPTAQLDEPSGPYTLLAAGYRCREDAPER